MNPLNTLKFKCLRCKQPIGEFYIGILNSDDLVHITYVDIRRLEYQTEQRDVEIYTGIQRELTKNRVKELSKYVNMVDATFPTGVILHIDQSDILEYNESNFEMTIPYRDSVAKVLDGQHRIAGLEHYSQPGENFQVNVVIFIGMDYI